LKNKKISQIGTSSEGRDFLRKLAGRSEESGAKADEKLGPSSLFNEMKDAYRALFIYGLIKGKRLPINGNFVTIYANIGMFADEYNFYSLLKLLGKEEDIDDIGKSINEYTNWAINNLIKEFGNDAFSIKKFMELMDNK